jgi:DNA-3-methyladenine glycosylase II
VADRPGLSSPASPDVALAGTLDDPGASAIVAAADPALAAFIGRAGPFTPRRGQGDAFTSLARAIVFQQLAGRAAAAIYGRFETAVGGRVTARAILATEPAVLRAAGLSGAKTTSLIDLATRTLDGTAPLAGIDRLSDDEIVERLTVVRGIGRWTVEMFLLFDLRRPDVWPVDDLGVRHGWSLIHDLPATITARALQPEGERFRPWRSVVALYCWHAVHVARGTVPAA